MFDTYPEYFLTSRLYIKGQSDLLTTYIRGIPGAIGFVPYAEVLAQSLGSNIAHVINRAGKTVIPGTENIEAVLESATLFTSAADLGKYDISLSDSNATLA